MKRSLRVMLGSILAFAFLGVLTLGIANSAGKKYPDTVTLDKVKKAMAPVSFPHKKHVEQIKVNCDTCHHKDKGKDTKRNCFDCHKEKKGDAPAAKKAFHTSCKGCHKEKGGNAPTKCKGCHKK